MLQPDNPGEEENACMREPTLIDGWETGKRPPTCQFGCAVCCSSYRFALSCGQSFICRLLCCQLIPCLPHAAHKAAALLFHKPKLTPTPTAPPSSCLQLRFLTPPGRSPSSAWSLERSPLFSKPKFERITEVSVAAKRGLCVRRVLRFL